MIMVEVKKKGGEMEGLVMRKVRVRLCLIVYGGGAGRREGVRWGLEGGGCSCRLWGYYYCRQSCCVCICECVFVYVSSGGEMRRYEIQLQGHYFLFFLRMSCSKTKKGLQTYRLSHPAVRNSHLHI